MNSIEFKIPELLAPAGGWDSLRAAVENGADAVYLGGRLFNARQNAGNFSGEELKKAIDYAHLRGVNVYLTMNTLLANDEMEAAVDFAGEAYLMGIDGIIVQDIGFAGIIRRLLPDLHLHASTQMTVYNLNGAKALEEMGFKRVVLARELSLGEIEKIAGGTSLEVEVFVHGALCVSYSGQCLMSSIIGGRSGNRGICAQPCRLPYKLENKGNIVSEGYLMSPKDLCSADILDKLNMAGIRSLKIEGRMKTPEYVAIVTGIYRKYLDLLKEGKYKSIDGEDMKALMQAFNRGGFSHGYLQGKTGKDMMAYEKPKNWGIYLGTADSSNSASRELRLKLDEDLSIGDGIEVWSGEKESPGTVVSSIKVGGIRTEDAKAGQYADVGYISGRINKGDKVYKTSSKSLNKMAWESFEKTTPRVIINGKLTIKEKQPLSLEISDGEKSVTVTGAMPEKALNVAIDTGRAAAQLMKTGGTPFQFGNIEVLLEEGLAVPASALNELRRKALEGIGIKRISRYERNLPREFVEKNIKKIYFQGNGRMPVHDNKPDIRYAVFLYKYDSTQDYSLIATDRIYIPFLAAVRSGITEKLEKIINKGIQIFAWFPPVTRGKYDSLVATGLGKLPPYFSGIVAGSLGNLRAAIDYGKYPVGDYSLNLFNNWSLHQLADIGLRGMTISPELDLERIEKLEVPGDVNVEAVVYGRLPLMTSEYCPVGALQGGFTGEKHCKGNCCGNDYVLRDRKGVEFPVLTDPTDCRSTILNSTIIYVPEIQKRLINAGVNIMRLNMFDESIGEINEILELYREAAQSGTSRPKKHVGLDAKIRSAGFTRGHYLRGV